MNHYDSPGTKVIGEGKSGAVLKFVTLSLVAVCAPPMALADELERELRQTAEELVRIESAVDKRDQGAFCNVTMELPSYVLYMKRVCETGVRLKAMTQEECSEVGLKLEAKRDIDKCNGFSPAEFNHALNPWLEAKQEFLKKASAKGLNGDTMLRDARAKLR